MNLNLELISSEVANSVYNLLKNYDICLEETVEIEAATILSEIRDVIVNVDLSDFDAIEEIVCILEKHNIYAGDRHDFG